MHEFHVLSNINVWSFFEFVATTHGQSILHQRCNGREAYAAVASGTLVR